MHMGNARGGVLGDTLANVLARDGWDVWKEFYVNDAGNQINKFARSIYRLHGGQHLAVPLGAQGEVQEAGSGDLHLAEVAALQLHVVHEGLGNVPGGLFKLVPNSRA